MGKGKEKGRGGREGCSAARSLKHEKCVEKKPNSGAVGAANKNTTHACDLHERGRSQSRFETEQGTDGPFQKLGCEEE